MRGNPLEQAITEASFQQAVTDLAETLGWLTYHTFDSRRSTPGFPDLVLCHPGQGGVGQLLFTELKTAKGRVSLGQNVWMGALRQAGAEVRLWRPADWTEIVDRLKARG